jgi:hypothetical protein
LETKKPDFAQTNGLDDLVKQLFACGGLLDRELQLRVHRRHPHVHLKHHQKRLFKPGRIFDRKKTSQLHTIL